MSRHDYETEFLPAALEILETPPSPLGRATAWLLVTLFVVALIWAVVGRVDMNATASGQFVPIGGVKAIQPLEAGIVRSILVDDGQAVEAGDLLVTLDATENTVDRSQLHRQLAEAREDAWRSRTTLSRLQHPLAEFTSESDHTAIGARQQQLLEANWISYQSKVSALQAQIEESKATIQVNLHEIKKHGDRLAFLSKRESALRQLYEHNGAAQMQWLEAQEESKSTRDSLAMERARAQQYQAALSRLQSELALYQSEMRQDNLTKLVEAKNKIKDLELNIARYESRDQQRSLRAPVKGEVQNLAVHTVGGVAQPAQTLMVVVPDEAKLIVEVKVLNADIGFVRAGQSARVKVETFPYTKYGVLNGTVEHVSSDATPDEHLGPVYTARVRLDEGAVTTTGKTLSIRAGMSVVVEIRTDDRRVIDYLLSPIKEVFSEAFTER